MATYNYLVDKDNKVQMTAGKVTREEFLEVVEGAKEFISIVDCDNVDRLYDLLDRPVNKLTLEDSINIGHILKTLLKFSVDRVFKSAVFYFVETIEAYEHEWDYYCEADEEKSKEYRDYKAIS